MLLGLRTVNYPAPDLAASRSWFTAMLGQEPYFDQPFYVGYEVGGYELGLNPALPPEQGAMTYWGVPDADAAMARLVATGATVHSPVTGVGAGIRLGTVVAEGGALLGIIENPHFAAVATPDAGPGPGR